MTEGISSTLLRAPKTIKSHLILVVCQPRNSIFSPVNTSSDQEISLLAYDHDQPQFVNKLLRIFLASSKPESCKS